MDYEEFFREQDQRMNLPDDDFNEYLRRMGTYRESYLPGRPPAPSYTLALNPKVVQELDPPLEAPQVPAKMSSDMKSDASSVSPTPACPPIPKSEIIKGKDSAMEADPSPPTSKYGDIQDNLNNTTKSQSLNEQTSPQAQKCKAPQLRSGSGLKRQKTSTSSHSCYDPSLAAARTSAIADISEIFLDVDPGPSKGQSPPTSCGLKRKLSDANVTELPPRKKLPGPSKPLRRTPSPSFEEITSFSACPKIKRKSPAPRPIPKEKQGSKAATKRKIPALNLQPIVPPLRTAATLPSIPTSPCQDRDADRQRSAPKEDKGKARQVSRGTPSKLYLEVKDRVAQHTVSKRRDNVVKLGTKPHQPIPTVADESSIYVSSSSSSPAPPSSMTTRIAPAKVAPRNGPSSKAEKSKAKPSKGKAKEKPPPVTPVEYAVKLQDKIAAIAAKSDKPKCLSGLTIFYAGGDMQYASERTRGRMDIIVKNGGILVPKYDASVVTHIVTDAQKRSTLQSLGLRNLKDIPDHIPTVTWKWVISRLGKPPICAKDVARTRADDIWMYAAFSERMDAGSAASFYKGKEKANGGGDLSNISDFTMPSMHRKRANSTGSFHHASESEEERQHLNNDHVIPGAPMSPVSPPRHVAPSASSSKLPDSRQENVDPLSEFYARARAARETGWSRHEEEEDSDVMPSSDVEREELVVPKKPQKRGWTCDTKEVQRQTCVNQDIIDKLQELKDLHQAKPGDDDHWRVFSYSKCIRALRNHPKRIESFAEARSIRGVGEKTAAKIMEVIETGGLRRIEYERTEDIETTKLFQGIYGVGQATAYQWYAAGSRTLEDLVSGKHGVKLNSVQEIGVRFYDDINDRMPREEAKEIFDLIKPIALNIDPKLFIEIMGSYRRGKATCGDIDILVTRPTEDGRTHKGVIARLLQELHTAGILMEDLALPDDPDDLEATYRGLCRVPREGSKRRRIDFLAVPWQCRGAALLYYTGDDIFNRAMRMKANVMGYSLNQKGLFGGVVRDPRDRRVKLNTGTLVASETEQEIFKILNVPWQEPHERVRG